MKRIMPKSLRSKTSMAVIVTAAVLVELTSGVQYWFAKKGIQEGVEYRAQSELRVKGLEIRIVMTAVEVAVENMAWAVEQNLGEPDSILPITQKLLADNKYIVGSAVAFEPYYYKGKGRQFSPYTYKHDGTTTSKQLGTDQYDYHSMEWYTSPMESGRSHWSEPYFDEGGGEMMMSTFSLPIRDSHGRIVAIFTADVSLDWLSDLINAHHIYPSSYNLLLSRTGKIMACPQDSLVMRKTITEVTSGMEDTTVNQINRQMMAGQSGQAEVRDDNGEKNYVFYSRMDDNTGWSMAVVCSDREIFHTLRQVGFNLFLLMLVGMVLLGYIIWRAARSAIHLQNVNAEKERMARELHIASEIQKGMLPKTFPPYPDRDDVEIFGLLVPAKEVGGDLFDFFIRDEKLFFCIGDVSGKGVPASLVMAVTRSLFRTVSSHESNPERIVTQMNDSMAEMNDTNMFVTLFMGVLDLPTGRLRYCNAGHCSPLLIEHSKSQTENLSATANSENEIKSKILNLQCNSNLPLGITARWKFEGQKMLIHPQTTIFLYTDGLTEAENETHKQYGDNRMREEVHSIDPITPKSLIEHMSDTVNTFVGDADQSDDLTMLAIQYSKKQLDVLLSRKLTLQNDIQQVPQLTKFVDEVCEAVGFDSSTTMQMNLAIEEAVVNVMNYAYPHGITGDIHIEAQANDSRLKFTITDMGKPFDPTAMGEIDTSLPTEERPIGGLGIHLFRQIMDSINYERLQEGKNVLTLRKKLNN